MIKTEQYTKSCYDRKKPHGELHFMYDENTKVRFWFATNELSGDVMEGSDILIVSNDGDDKNGQWVSNGPPEFISNYSSVKHIIKALYKNVKVLRHTGSFIPISKTPE